MSRTIVYIAGYGRSGSTLLERILSSHPRIIGVGELAYLPSLVTQKGNGHPYCACGDPVDQCEFWSCVIQQAFGSSESLQELIELQARFESLTGSIRRLSRPDRGSSETYEARMRNLIDRIFACSEPDPDLVIDSSKTARMSAWRPLALAHRVGVDVKVIHLVRDGRGCMWSYIKGSNRQMESGKNAKVPFAAWRAGLSWMLANLAVHRFQLNKPENYCRVRYEDFVQNPDDVLRRLGAFLGINFERQLEMIQKSADIPLGHQVAGNRLRSQRKIVLRLDEEWRQHLKRRHHALFWVLDGVLTWLYGYH